MGIFAEYYSGLIGNLGNCGYKLFKNWEWVLDKVGNMAPITKSRAWFNPFERKNLNKKSNRFSACFNKVKMF